MADKGFGSDLWKNVQSVKFDKDGALHVPVRANGKDGIVVGVDAIARSEATRPAPTESRPSWWRRLLRRG